MTGLGTLFVKLSADATELKKAFDDGKSQMEAFSSAASGIAKVAASAFAGLTAAIGGATYVADQQRIAELRLGSAIKGTGAAIDPQRIKDYAASLQQLTTFGDEASIEAAAMLTTFQLTEDQVVGLLPRVQNLASMYGMDLRTSAITVGKALSSGVGVLSRYGITLSEVQKEAYKTADATQRVSILMEALDRNTGPAAQILANTATGAMKQFKNAVGDAIEQLGFMVDIPIKEAFQGVTESVAKLTGWLSSLSPQTKEFIGKLAIGITIAAGVTAALAAIASVIPTLIAGFSALGVVVSGALWPATVIIAAIVAALASVVLYVGVVKKIWTSNFLGIRTSTLSVIKSISAAFNWLWGAITSGVQLVVEAHMSMFRLIADAVKKITFGKVDIKVPDTAGDLFEKMSGAVGDAIDVAADKASKVGSLLADSFVEGISTIGGMFKGLLPDFSAQPPTNSSTAGGMGAEVGGTSTATKATSATAPTSNEPMAGGISDISSQIQPIIDEQAASWAAVGETFNSALSNLSQGATTAANNYLQSQVAAGQISQEAASRMASDTQDATNVMSAAVNGFAKGGVMGAVTGALSSLFSKSNAFGKVVTKLGALFSGLMKALEPLFRTLSNALQPVFEALSKILAPISSLLQVLSILTPLFKLVGKIFEVVGNILYVFAWVIASVWNFLLDIVASIVGIFSKSKARSIRNQKIHVTRELAEEDNTSATNENTDATRQNTTQVHEFGETVESVNEELGNVPDAFKIANARFNAIDGVTSDITTPPAEGSGGAFSGATINIIAQDPEEAYDRLQDAAAKRSFESSGTTIVRGDTHGTGTTGGLGRR
jgi:hypothetical protein